MVHRSECRRRPWPRTASPRFLSGWNVSRQTVRLRELRRIDLAREKSSRVVVDVIGVVRPNSTWSRPVTGSRAHPNVLSAEVPAGDEQMVGSSLTPRWRKVDSNHRFPATVSFDDSERCSGSSRLALLFLRPIPFREQLGQKRHFLRSWNRSTQMPLVRYYSALFQDQLQAP
jgi:hypothetical protein